MGIDHGAVVVFGVMWPTRAAARAALGDAFLSALGEEAVDGLAGTHAEGGWGETGPWCLHLSSPRACVQALPSAPPRLRTGPSLASLFADPSAQLHMENSDQQTLSIKTRLIEGWPPRPFHTHPHKSCCLC